MTMSEDDHKYFFGQMPEMPWKSRKAFLIDGQHYMELDDDDLIDSMCIGRIRQDAEWQHPPGTVIGARYKEFKKAGIVVARPVRLEEIDERLV